MKTFCLLQSPIILLVSIYAFVYVQCTVQHPDVLYLPPSPGRPETPICCKTNIDNWHSKLVMVATTKTRHAFSHMYIIYNFRERYKLELYSFLLYVDIVLVPVLSLNVTIFYRKDRFQRIIIMRPQKERQNRLDRMPLNTEIAFMSCDKNDAGAKNVKWNVSRDWGGLQVVWMDGIELVMNLW
jgi:hypothetical protein